MSGHGTGYFTHGFIGHKSSQKQLEWKMDSIMEVRTNLLTLLSFSKIQSYLVVIGASIVGHSKFDCELANPIHRLNESR